MNINVLIPCHEYPFNVAWLVGPIVQGTTVHPRCMRKLKS